MAQTADEILWKKNTTRANQKVNPTETRGESQNSNISEATKKTGKTSGTQKAKAETKTTSKRSTKKPSGKSTTRQKRKDPGIKAVRSYDQKLFPWATFSYRLDDKREKKVLVPVCFEHAEKYITRYKMLTKEYNSYDFHALGRRKIKWDAFTVTKNSKYYTQVEVDENGDLCATITRNYYKRWDGPLTL